ncbi:hypothetical protein H4R20_003759 [Coemansia guatemalensis]|uniref:ARM repeat-containing protein n=1 Tax=Coemansia guatemalensis TaxID=2761395 RepID=A0A9W8HVN2_9FUNG|nr:hypothetical protein H4R20_003759 [Coemansia guatemalensis]
MAELDSLLICAAADCVAEFADVFGDAFEPIMDTFLPHIAGYAKPAVAVSERAMAVGCLAEISKNMGPGITKYAECAGNQPCPCPELFPVFMRALQDEHAELRSNAAFGVGAFIESATVDASAYFNDVLKALYPLFGIDGNPNNVKDNAAGCVARLILENADAVPLADVLPVWISALPIRGDHLEDIPVYDAICHLFRNKRAEVSAKGCGYCELSSSFPASPDWRIWRSMRNMTRSPFWNGQCAVGANKAGKSSLILGAPWIAMRPASRQQPVLQCAYKKGSWHVGMPAAARVQLLCD